MAPTVYSTKAFVISLRKRQARQDRLDANEANELIFALQQGLILPHAIMGDSAHERESAAELKKIVRNLRKKEKNAKIVSDEMAFFFWLCVCDSLEPRSHRCYMQLFLSVLPLITSPVDRCFILFYNNQSLKHMHRSIVSTAAQQTSNNT